MMKPRVTRPSPGFSLVEVTLALGVAAFCLLALFGLLPLGVNSNQTSIEQTAAASAAASIIADLRATPVVSTAAAAAGATPPYSSQYGIQVPLPPTTPATSTTPLPAYTLFLRDDGSLAPGTAAPGLTGSNMNPAQNPRYRVTLVFNPPATGQLGVTPVRVLVTWPAVADPSVATSSTDVTHFPSKFSGSFEVVTALDRN